MLYAPHLFHVLLVLPYLLVLTLVLLCTLLLFCSLYAILVQSDFIRSLFVVQLLKEMYGPNDPITSMDGHRVPPWATARDLGFLSRPPVAGDEGHIARDWIVLEAVPIRPVPEWSPPGDWPETGDTTEGESQSSNAETDFERDDGVYDSMEEFM